MKAEVERWLSACIVAGHDMPYGDNSHVSFEVEAPTLEALCRAWLALDSAPVGRLDIGRNDFDDDDMVEIVMDPNHVSHLQYQRVRIVPEQGEG